MQANLFTPAELEAAENRTAWRRVGGYGGPRSYNSSCGSIHYLGDTGFGVRHCGHPTALWPWYGFGPGGETILAPNGRAFQTLDRAKAATLERYRQRKGSP